MRVCASQRQHKWLLTDVCGTLTHNILADVPNELLAIRNDLGRGRDERETTLVVACSESSPAGQMRRFSGCGSCNSKVRLV